MSRDRKYDQAQGRIRELETEIERLKFVLDRILAGDDHNDLLKMQAEDAWEAEQEAAP